ncbi:Long-chain-fatty-acid--CoA ligase [Paraconexibacter sp. AEG42_29]|uniref:Long-chain-fatty-acid--CoA ligase n=1 Tax=Paraconexibacter sp. AEG42_29 TaxID=2997339 RepID=A0AAU7AU88_9ACTN
MKLVNRLADPAQRASLEARSLRALARAGALGLENPHKFAQILNAMRSYGPYGAAPRIAALRHGGQTAIADEFGQITFDEFEEQINRLTSAWMQKGLGPGATIGILCRNHRAPLIASFAASRLGANAVWLNTAFSTRQVTEVAEREGVDFLVYDIEFTDAVAGISPARGKLACATEDAGDDELRKLIAGGDPRLTPAPAKPGRIVLLTSGTTGTPKGAPRPEPKSLTIPGALLDRMPMKAREATVIGPPLFHGTGLVIALLAISLGSTLVLRRKFEAGQFLDDLATHKATGACVVPIMLQRVLALGEEDVRRRDLSALRVVFCAGSQLPAEVATKAQALLGPVIYNLYGSTEVSVATLATPEDVRVAPQSVGRPALGAKIRIFDEAGKELPQGQTGRIFVGTTSPFEGYTGGGKKDVIDGLMSTGDVGHFDANGRLFIDGRDDEMIVSGGENVFPREVEELLVTHEAIADAAAIGVDDEDFGKRLRAFVVLKPGQDVSEEAVQAFVKDNLARYKSPREVLFLDDLPRNPTGKILKRELAELEVPSST